MVSRRTSWLAIGLLAVAVTGCGSDESSRTGVWEVSEDLDRSLSIVPIRIEYSPSCERLEGLDVEEHPDRVEITVRLTVDDPGRDAACADVAVSTVTDVELDDPLGERELTGPGLQPSAPDR